jgi:hypothetical protein
VDALIATLLCGALIAIFASSKGRMAVISAAALLVLSAVEFKAFGTSKRFNASPGPVSNDQTSPFLPGMNKQTYKTLLEHPEYRMASDDHGPDPVELRHSGLTSPQGSDPFLTAQYRNLMEGLGNFSTNRRFDLDPENEEALHLLGVRYFATAEAGPLYHRLLASPRYRLMTPDDSYYKIFELADSQASFGWETAGTAEKALWEPEKRAFRVQSPDGGIFRLSEQSLPGWHATIDGAEVPIERCHKAFQCVALSRGAHLVEFRYRSRWLRTGCIISLSSVFLAIAAMWMTRSTG